MLCFPVHAKYSYFFLAVNLIPNNKNESKYITNERRQYKKLQKTNLFATTKK